MAQELDKLRRKARDGKLPEELGEQLDEVGRTRRLTSGLVVVHLCFRTPFQTHLGCRGCVLVLQRCCRGGVMRRLDTAPLGLSRKPGTL
jgi:hypothetical protein